MPKYNIMASTDKININIPSLRISNTTPRIYP